MKLDEVMWPQPFLVQPDLWNDNGEGSTDLLQFLLNSHHFETPLENFLSRFRARQDRHHLAGRGKNLELDSHILDVSHASPMPLLAKCRRAVATHMSAFASLTRSRLGLCLPRPQAAPIPLGLAFRDPVSRTEFLRHGHRGV